MCRPESTWQSGVMRSLSMLAGVQQLLLLLLPQLLLTQLLLTLTAGHVLPEVSCCSRVVSVF